MLLQNSFPPSETISSGNPYLQIHLLKSAEATVGASLFGSATSSASFENASVIHMMYFFPDPEVFRGPNRSICIL